MLIFLSFSLQSQEVKKHDKKSYKDKTGKLYWNKEMPVYIRLASSPSDTGQLLKSSKSQKYTEPYYFDTEGDNTIRTRWAIDPVTGKQVSPKTEVIWDVYADSKSPISFPGYLNVKPYNIGQRKYFGNNLSVSIAANDKLSGVEKTYYSINSEPYKEYTDEFKIPKEGDYVLKYYSVDNVGNIEDPKQDEFSIDATPPTADYVLSGGTYNNIFSVHTKVMLMAKDTLAGVGKIMYQLDEGKEKTYTGKAISLASLDNGDHKFNFYALDNVQNKGKTRTFNFYLDKMAPILSSTIIGDQFAKDGKIYFSGRSILKLTGVDDKAGLKEIKYKVDEAGTEFMTYSEPFYLPSISGLHTVKYYALDNMQNKTETQRGIDAKYENYVFNEEKIYVDLTAPKVYYKFQGTNFVTRDTLFLSGNTKIKLTGVDSESGIGKIVYKIDGVPASENYSGAFDLNKLKGGVHKIEIICYDNVSNKTNKDFTFILDNTPPKLHYFYSVAPYGTRDGYKVYSKYVTVYLAATDMTTGVKDIYYKVNNAKELKYTGSISGFSTNILNTVKLRTIDKLGNESIEEINFYVK